MLKIALAKQVTLWIKKETKILLEHQHVRMHFDKNVMAQHHMQVYISCELNEDLFYNNTIIVYWNNQIKFLFAILTKIKQ